jgi:hypothetical protein
MLNWMVESIARIQRIVYTHRAVSGKKTHDFSCAEIENALCSWVWPRTCLREDEYHVQTYSDLPIIAEKLCCEEQAEDKP